MLFTNGNILREIQTLFDFAKTAGALNAEIRLKCALTQF